MIVPNEDVNRSSVDRLQLRLAYDERSQERTFASDIASAAGLVKAGMVLLMCGDRCDTPLVFKVENKLLYHRMYEYFMLRCVMLCYIVLGYSYPLHKICRTCFM